MWGVLICAILLIAIVHGLSAASDNTDAEQAACRESNGTVVMIHHTSGWFCLPPR